jgi:replicative superfamily II helicase
MEEYNSAYMEVQKSKNRELKELFANGFGIHHAGIIIII